eukprot:s3705_g4.t1
MIAKQPGPGAADNMSTQLSHPTELLRIVLEFQCLQETKSSRESLLEATGWKMQLRDFVQLSLGPGLSSFRTMVSSSRRVNMQPDVDASRFPTPEQDPPSSPCAGRRFLRFGDPSFISPPSSYSLSASSPTSPTSPASTQSCSPRATSAPPASCVSEAAEEEEEEDDESDMKFVQAVTDRLSMLCPPWKSSGRRSPACGSGGGEQPVRDRFTVAARMIRSRRPRLWEGPSAPKFRQIGLRSEASSTSEPRCERLTGHSRLPMVALRILKSAGSTNTGVRGCR